MKKKWWQTNCSHQFLWWQCSLWHSLKKYKFSHKLFVNIIITMVRAITFSRKKSCATQPIRFDSIWFDFEWIMKLANEANSVDSFLFYRNEKWRKFDLIEINWCSVLCVCFWIPFDYSYELDNGQIFSEQGELKTIGDSQAVVKSGAYSFVSPDGVVHWVTYTADENGFHPVVGKLRKHYFAILRHQNGIEWSSHFPMEFEMAEFILFLFGV